MKDITSYLDDNNYKDAVICLLDKLDIKDLDEIVDCTIEMIEFKRSRK